MEYIEALCAVYGRVEKLPDLVYKFEPTHQCKGERLSDCHQSGSDLAPDHSEEGD